MRRKKLLYNTITSFINQFISIICGFILPRFLLSTYGSEVNGLVSSITQFLGVIAFMQLGVGAVVQSTLYEPLAKKDNEQISKIYISSERFFRTIATIFIIYTIGLVLFYPNTVNNSFDFWFTASLIIIISFSSFSQYFFGITNQLLLNADQKSYITLIIDTVTLIGHTITSVMLMKCGASIQIVKLATTLIYMLRPILMALYVRKKYIINKKLTILEEPIKQKWNGFAHHLASAVMDNTDVIVLTVCASLNDVSIYYVYHLVVYGIRQMITSLTTGLQSFCGNMLAKKEMKSLKNAYSHIELAFHILVTFLFTCTSILIVPFISVYTNGIKDVNYEVPLFAFILTFSQAIYCYRLIYFVIIKAAGHYKQTQKSALIEMGINIVLSILLVIKYGLIGVAIGTFISTLYRMIYFIKYLSNNIIEINIKTTAYKFMVDIISIMACYLFTRTIKLVDCSYVAWILMAIKVAFICGVTIIIIYYVFNFKMINQIVKRYWKKISLKS